MTTGDLFPVSADVEQPAAFRAPEGLNPAEHRKLRKWAEERVPWVSRGALDSLTPIDEYVDACLAHFRGTKKMRPGWVGTIENWIRGDERSRLTKMALAGNEGARLALRDPAQWRDQYDRVTRQMGGTNPSAGGLIVPPSRADSGRSASLQRGKNRR